MENGYWAQVRRMSKGMNESEHQAFLAFLFDARPTLADLQALAADRVLESLSA